ncbi:MAG: AraC family transcriptional regulator [Pirellula sp.]|nr:AraC family transcriptional regulator [Pirellula sp.]
MNPLKPLAMCPASIDIDLLSKLFDLSPDVAFFIKDAAGKYIAVNQSLVERHGLKSKSQVLGRSPREICPGDFGQIPTEQDRRVLQTGKSLIEHLEMQWLTPDNPVWCLTTKLPIRDSSGNITGIIGFSKDLRVALNPKEIPEDFANALRDFEQSLAPEFTPAWLAERSNLSSQRLARLTKRLFGLTPSHLLTKSRIAAATRMLREDKLSISEIALACGFYDHSAFTRSFRSAIGVTPTEFRNQT